MTSQDGTYLQEAADRAMILDLVQRYAYYADYGPAESFAALFTKDACFEVPAVGLALHGTEALKRVIAFAQASDLGVHHVQSGFVIDIDRDTATGACEVNVFLANTDSVPCVTQGRYTDRYERTDGRWYFASRTFTLTDAALQALTNGPLGEPIASMLSEFTEKFGPQP